VNLRREVTALLVVLAATACGKSASNPGREASAAPPATPTRVVDTSTPEDWTANCAARYVYRNKLMFSATQSVRDGQTTATSLSTSRAPYRATFTSLKLDGVPELKAKRDQVLAMIDQASGGASVGIGAELNKADDALWEEVLRLAKAHGIDCLALEKK
jgi:hypothetical protein